GDHTVRLWASATGAPLATLQGHWDRLLSIAFSPDGTRLLTSSEDKTARLWDAQAGQTLLHLGPGKGRAGAPSPHGALAVTGNEDGSARIWDLRTGALRVTLTGHAAPITVAFSPDGRHVVTASQDGTARLWDPAGRLLHELRVPAPGIRGAAFSP